MFSQMDREVILHIKNLFLVDDLSSKYLEEINTIILEIKGDRGTHPFFVTCWNNILTIKTIKKIDIKNLSFEFFKFVLELNRTIPFGSFCCEPEGEFFGYRLDVLIFEIPPDKMTIDLMAAARSVLDVYLPEMFLKAQAIGLSSKKPANSTYQ